MRLSEHRVGGRSLSVLRPDDQLRCNALAGCSGSRIQCLQWVAGVAAAPAHALLACAHGRQQTSMPSGSGLLPGPTLRAPRARWDLGQWDGWTIPTGGSGVSAGWCSAEHGWPLPSSLWIVFGSECLVAEPCDSKAAVASSLVPRRVLNSSTFGPRVRCACAS